MINEVFLGLLTIGGKEKEKVRVAKINLISSTNLILPTLRNSKYCQ